MFPHLKVQAQGKSDNREAAWNAKSSKPVAGKSVVKNDSKIVKVNPKITKPEKETKGILDVENTTDDDPSSTTSNLLSFADRVTQKRVDLDI